MNHCLVSAGCRDEYVLTCKLSKKAGDLGNLNTITNTLQYLVSILSKKLGYKYHGSRKSEEAVYEYNPCHIVK